MNKDAETHVVVINCTSLKRNLYKVEFAEADGTIHEQTVHEEAILDYQLVIGKELDQETFEALQNSNDYQKAYAYAINILSRKLYSTGQIKQKLHDREFNDNTTRDVILKLTEIELLNDFAFATAYIEHHLAMGKKSHRQIISDLKIRGVAHGIIDDLNHLFAPETEQASITREIKKAYERYNRNEISDFDLRNKVMTSLGRKGFNLGEVGRQYGYFIEDLEAGI
jgi:regulatory protein